MIFRGTSEFTLDAKHRLTIPAKFRASLDGKIVVSISPETQTGKPRSLAIWTPDAYSAWTASALDGLNPMSSRARDLKLMFAANSDETELDGAGRVMIQPTLRAYAGLDKEVTVVGAFDCLEVWNRETYAAYNEANLARFTEITASFDHTD